MHTSRFRLVWALAAAAVTGLGVYMYLNSLRTLDEVVVARQEIPARTVLTAEMIETRTMNRAERRRFFPRATRIPAEAVGLVATRDIEPGEVLHGDQMLVRTHGQPDAGQGDPSQFIPLGLRAVTVTVDSQGAVGGHLRRGHRVDVVFTPRTRDATVSPGLLLAAVDVYAVESATGKGLSRSSKDLLNVTLLVSPEQAVVFNMAKRQGDIDMTLVPLAEQAVADLAAVYGQNSADAATGTEGGEPRGEAGSGSGEQPSAGDPR